MQSEPMRSIACERSNALKRGTAVSSSGQVILLIEDNAASMEFCQVVLEAYGYSVLQATNGIEGLRMACEHRPDLILTDIQLPTISGLEVAKWLNEHEILKAIPVVAVTALAIADSEKRCRDSGCDGYIPKPITIAALIQTVKQFLDQPNSQTSATRRHTVA